MAVVAAGITAVGMIGAAAASGTPSAPVMTNPRLTTDGMFDFSGWNIASGGSTIDYDRKQEEAGPMLESDGYLKYFIMAGAFLILWKVVKKQSS